MDEARVDGVMANNCYIRWGFSVMLEAFVNQVSLMFQKKKKKRQDDTFRCWEIIQLGLLALKQVHNNEDTETDKNKIKVAEQENQQ